MSYITIYFGDKPVYLCDQLTTEIEEVRHHPDAVFIDEVSKAAVNSLFHEMEKKQFHAGIILGEDFNRLKKLFFSHFNQVKTAGAVIFNQKGEILLMFRRGKWDLPKGKQDDNETLLACALREVQEETGLSRLKPGKEIGITYHTYIEFGKHILKESHWFIMESAADETLIPQVAEDITELCWVKREELKNYLDNTYPTIVSILKVALHISH
jgi:8-oxo-dGTP pyrophosphatase MutT (NUDIX family)